MVATIVKALLLLLALSRATAAQDTALADRLVWAALDREAAMDYDSALALYRAARDASPARFDIHLQYRNIAILLGRTLETRREYEELRRSKDARRACIGVVAAAPVGGPFPFTEIADVRARFGETECTAYFASATTSHDIAIAARLDDVISHYARAAHYRPRDAGFWAYYANVLAEAHRWDEAKATLRYAMLLHPHPLERTLLQLYLAWVVHRNGDTARASALRKALRAAIERDGRPGLRFTEMNYVITLRWGDSATLRNARREGIRIARQHGAWSVEAMWLENLGADHIDHGETAAALEPLDRAVALSDSVASPYWQAVVYTRRGRAYAKLGRLREAEQNLRLAAARSREIREPFRVAEAYHNLAHVYEAQGRFADASAAADQYVLAANTDRTSDAAMMSHHDAGLIRWKAGWHAAANAAFEQLVRIIEEQRQNYYWAGEYHERIGDWQRALEYYRRGLDSRAPSDRNERINNLAGAARAYAALGLMDSAETVARTHDGLRERWGPWNTPLLPIVLARRGQLDEAVAVAASWAAQQLRSGNVQGAALAHVQVAELLLQWSKPARALDAAQTAESLAVTLNLTDEIIDARRLSGVALISLGQVDSGLNMLRAAAILAERRPTAAGLLRSHVALGDALSTLHRADQALAAYGRAARVVETMTGRFDIDVDRARFRDRHLAPFEGALRTLLNAAGSTERRELIVAWSQRRKAMALLLSTRSVSDTGRTRLPPPLPMSELRDRLSVDEALIDYVVLDSLTAAIVVTRDHVTVRRLPSAPAAISALVERLRRPLMTTYVGRLDLARAPYDLSLANELHERLLEPLLPLLGSRNRLILVPDGVLHHVPFEALPVRRASNRAGMAAYAASTYVADVFALAYLPSALFLQPRSMRESTVTPRTNRLLAITHEAAGGTRETEAISAAWPRGRAEILDGPAATEGAVRAKGHGRRVLHFATHAQADDRDPLGSHLRLAADGEHDGYLHLTEISQLRIEAPLVVLSACETLRGQLLHGEGMMGLARAFLASGAGAVVATRWPVGPATADFMAEFYRALAAGRAPTSALRSARDVMRRNPATAHPFYWAGFILIFGKPM